MPDTIPHSASPLEAGPDIAEQHQMAMEASTDGVAITDAAGIVLQTNPAQIRMFGYRDAAQIKGRDSKSFFTDHAIQHFDQVIAPALAIHGHWQGESEGIRADGSSFPVDVSVAALPSGGLVCVTRDATARKAQEAERLRLAESLSRTQAREALGKLAGGMAHEFNNILAGMMGYANLLAEMLPEGAEKGFAREIVHAGTRASALVDQLAVFARPRASIRGRQDPRRAVAQVTDILRPILSADIVLDIEDLSTDVMVDIDEQQFRQAILNLCINACEAIGADKNGRISLSQRLISGARICADIETSAALPANGKVTVDPDGNLVACYGEICRDDLCNAELYYEIAVVDNGSGMTEEVIERMFDPFFTTKPPGDGSGLGLSAVQGIVSAHNGLICVSSRPGKGTRISVGLPCTAEMKNNDGDLAVTRRGVPGDGKILIADDEQQVADVLKLLLGRLGYEADTVADGREALRILCEDPASYRALISDQTMPSLTGTELLVALRDHGVDIPVILCSGYSDSLDMDAAKRMGVITFLQKPVTPEALRTALAEFETITAAASE